MAVPELVVVPARPGAGDGCPVEFEVRTQTDGPPVLPVFSVWRHWCGTGVGDNWAVYQPWVCVPRRMAAEAGQAGHARVLLDPVVGASG
jgi:hypothetical protein